MRPPVVIGALGGSGTRLVTRIVLHAGFFMGSNRNESEDAMEFVKFFDRWINPFIDRKETPFTDKDAVSMESEFFDCIEKHRTEITNEQIEWGWKEPRSIYLLPFLHRYFPNLRFIHVIRDGRDMAFSENQNQLRKHGKALLPSLYDFLPQPEQTAMLWNEINLMALEYGERDLRERYKYLRFEDLCRDPKATIGQISKFLEKNIDMDAALNEVAIPPSIGRWTNCGSSELLDRITRHAHAALVRFGYI